jgi:hypothetical protein
MGGLERSDRSAVPWGQSKDPVEALETSLVVPRDPSTPLHSAQDDGVIGSPHTNNERPHLALVTWLSLLGSRYLALGTLPSPYAVFRSN